MADNLLMDFDDGKGHAMFVSHQWVGLGHPDPDCEQLKVLQEALKRIQSEATSSIAPGIVIELSALQGPVRSSDITSQPLSIWYDYFCCPQNQDMAAEQRRLAILSIPAYVERCQYFVILCPHVQHKHKDVLLSKETWSTRGWCRLELVVRHLSTRASIAIEVHSASRQILGSMFDWVIEPVGEGEFTLEDDVTHVGQVLHSLVKHKLEMYLRTGKLHFYRMLFNFQTVIFRNMDVNPIAELIPNFSSTTMDPARHSVEQFMHQNGLRNVRQRDSAGWTALCYAALAGSPLLICAILEARADVNDRVKLKGKQLVNVGNNTTALSLCALLRHNEAMKVLLSFRADPEIKDSYGGTAMHRAAAGHNAEGVFVLLAYGASPTAGTVTGHLPFLFTVGGGDRGVAVLKELLPHTPKDEIASSLQSVFLLGGGGHPGVVATLIEAEADVNMQTSVPRLSVLGLVLASASLRHYWSQSTLTMYAYHRQGATPLILSLVTCSFQAAAVLASAGARTDIVNARGATAMDIAKQVSAPAHILQGLAGDLSACEAVVQEHSSKLWFSI